MEGIDIQYLNGIEGNISLSDVLDDSDFANGILFNPYLAVANANKRKQTIDAVTNGYDLDYYSGVNNVADAESVRNYIVRTKKVVDECPELIQGYRNPEQLSSMLAYVLKYWDTADRERAIEIMAKEEAREIRKGNIHIDSDDKKDYYGGSFFAALADMFAPRSEDARQGRDLLRGYNEVTRRIQAKSRQKVAVNGIVTSYIDDNAYDKDEDFIACSLNYGFKLPNQALGALGATEQVDNTLAYLYTFKAMVERRPKLFVDSDEAHEQLLSIINNAIDSYGKGIGSFWSSIGDFAKKATKLLVNPVELVKATVIEPTKATIDTIKNVIKDPSILINPVKATKEMFALGKNTIVKPTVELAKIAIIEPTKAAWHLTVDATKAIVKITKEIVKFFIRWNPFTIAARGAVLLSCRRNWFHLAEKCYPAILDYNSAKNKGYVDDEEHYNNAIKNYDKLWTIFKRFGGKEKKLKHALEVGSEKVWNGEENPDEVDLTSLQNEVNNDADFESAYNEDIAEIEATADISEEVDSEDIVWEEKQITEQVISNIITTVKATTLFNDPNSSESAGTLPTNTSVYYDTEYDDPNFVRIEYNDNNYYVRKAAFDIAEGQAPEIITNELVVELDNAEFYSEPQLNGLTLSGSELASLLKKGDKVLVDFSWQNPDWIHVNYNGKSGYMRRSDFGITIGKNLIQNSDNYIKDLDIWQHSFDKRGWVNGWYRLSWKTKQNINRWEFKTHKYIIPAPYKANEEFIYQYKVRTDGNFKAAEISLYIDAVGHKFIPCTIKKIDDYYLVFAKCKDDRDTKTGLRVLDCLLTIDNATFVEFKELKLEVGTEPTEWTDGAQQTTYRSVDGTIIANTTLNYLKFNNGQADESTVGAYMILQKGDKVSVDESFKNNDWLRCTYTIKDINAFNKLNSEYTSGNDIKQGDTLTGYVRKICVSTADNNITAINKSTVTLTPLLKRPTNEFATSDIITILPINYPIDVIATTSGDSLLEDFFLASIGGQSGYVNAKCLGVYSVSNAKQIDTIELEKYENSLYERLVEKWLSPIIGKLPALYREAFKAATNGEMQKLINEAGLKAQWDVKKKLEAEYESKIKLVFIAALDYQSNPKKYEEMVEDEKKNGTANVNMKSTTPDGLLFRVIKPFPIYDSVDMTKQVRELVVGETYSVNTKNLLQAANSQPRFVVYVDNNKYTMSPQYVGSNYGQSLMGVNLNGLGSATAAAIASGIATAIAAIASLISKLLDIKQSNKVMKQQQELIEQAEQENEKKVDEINSSIKRAEEDGYGSLYTDPYTGEQVYIEHAQVNADGSVTDLDSGVTYPSGGSLQPGVKNENGTLTFPYLEAKNVKQSAGMDWITGIVLGLVGAGTLVYANKPKKATDKAKYALNKDKKAQAKTIKNDKSVE